ncbi:MAG: FAD-dependent oxidoreductase [Hyphomicrobium sp.]|uniref:FAD-dependent oxidoreductase n=1 Tax=Hyphomicrobium sp. TaxID=82 RepID=UPI003D0E04D9
MKPEDLRDAAFPKLTDEQLAILEQCPLTKVKQYRAGEKIFEAGQRDLSFYVVKCGEIAVVDEARDTPHVVAVHGRGEFTGDVAVLTGTPSLVSAVARVDSELYEVSPDALRLILNTHVDLGDIIVQAFIARRHLRRESAEYGGLRVIGSRYSRDTFRVRDFLAKNRVPFTWFDLETDEQVTCLLQRLHIPESDTPVVIWGSKLVLRNPSDRELAEALGLRRLLEDTVYDLVVVGAGPAGLAAAVYGASEGLRTVALERIAPGGQAGRSMRIENYLGFPTGISGGDLAERAVVQANKFGAELPVAVEVVRLTFDSSYLVVHVAGGQQVVAKCLLISTGADYRMLPAPGCEEFEGRGVYYAATPVEAQMCWGSDVVVVGGGNSAGQAAVFLSAHVRTVYLVVRGDALHKSMSSYLIERIRLIPNIRILLNTEVRALYGDQYLREVELVDKTTGEIRRLKCAALFSFIGAAPRTEWLPPELEKDDHGFVLTGPALVHTSRWREQRRQPFLVETSRPGVFAVGDARAGSIKRVASAVGEGAMAVQFIHQYLSAM